MSNEQKQQPFVIDDDPQVEWPVIVKLPAAGGVFNEFQFTATFKVLSPKEYEDLFANLPGSKQVEGDKSPLMSEILAENVPVLQHLVIGWTDIKDKDGNEVPFSQETLAKLATGKYGRGLSAGLWKAISEIRYGARLGN